MSRFDFSCVWGAVLLLLSNAGYAEPLIAGMTLNTNGINEFTSPLQSGRVARNEFVPFEIYDEGGQLVIAGLLEDRVLVSSETGTYIFQSRLRDLSSNVGGSITQISLFGYSGVEVDADYLDNGIGNISARSVERGAGVGDRVTFVYDVPINATADSSFSSIRSNASAFEVSGELEITAQTAGKTYTTKVFVAAPSEVSTAIFPRQGLWWNPSRSGHGVDVEVIGGDTVYVVWYTYRDDNTPVWYLGSAEYDGKNWQASMDAFSWDGVQATGQSTGTIGFDFIDETHAVFWWQFAGEPRQQEPFEFFSVSEQRPFMDYTGTYYELAKPGYGVTLAAQDKTEFAVFYFYDASGRATWALGTKEGCGIETYRLDSYLGFCPTCPAVTPTLQDVGSISTSMTYFNAGMLSADITLKPPLTGAWKVNNARITNLSYEY